MHPRSDEGANGVDEQAGIPGAVQHCSHPAGAQPVLQGTMHTRGSQTLSHAHSRSRSRSRSHETMITRPRACDNGHSGRTSNTTIPLAHCPPTSRARSPSRTHIVSLVVACGRPRAGGFVEPHGNPACGDHNMRSRCWWSVARPFVCGLRTCVRASEQLGLV